MLDLVRVIESAALSLRNDAPPIGLEVDEPGIKIVLPFERPLYDSRPADRVQSLLDPAADAEVDDSALFSQTFVDQARLAENVRSAVPVQSSALLSDIVHAYPLLHGAAEIVGYLALSDDDLTVTVDERDETCLDYADGDSTRRVRLAKVTVTRR